MRFIMYKPENSKGNFTEFERALAVGFSMVPKGSPWKLLLITRSHLPHFKAYTDLSQLLFLWSHSKKQTGQHTSHRRWILAETWLLTTFMWVLIRKHLKEIFVWKTYSLDYYNYFPLSSTTFPVARIQKGVVYGQTHANNSGIQAKCILIPEYG